jgi:hypothetical protein
MFQEILLKQKPMPYQKSLKHFVPPRKGHMAAFFAIIA